MTWTCNQIAWERFHPGSVEPDLTRVIAAASLVEHNARSYGRYLRSVFHDDAAFCSAIDRWVAEEERHGEALRRWASLADPSFDGVTALARFAAVITNPESATTSIRGSRLGELVARCTVEIGTHTFYTAIAEASREPVLRQICQRIAGDEARHYRMFLDHARRYRTPWSLAHMALVVIRRIIDSGDDELAFAWRAGAGGDSFRCRADGARFHLAALRRYRRRHIERAAKLLAQVLGLSPDGPLVRLASLLGWRVARMRLRMATTLLSRES